MSREGTYFLVIDDKHNSHIQLRVLTMFRSIRGTGVGLSAYNSHVLQPLVATALFSLKSGLQKSC